jgi:hypothetical protein
MKVISAAGQFHKESLLPYIPKVVTVFCKLVKVYILPEK